MPVCRVCDLPVIVWGEDMMEILKEIIRDSHEAPIVTGIPRRLNTPAIPGKAGVFMGVRRSGKSTYMNQLMQGLIDGGLPRQNILAVNFFDDRLAELRRQGPAAVIDAYWSRFPEKKNVETIHCFFDEIQEVADWEPFVDRLLRTENCQVYLTGSSAKMLSSEIATQMRGRSIPWEVFPFSFPEYLDSRGIQAPAVPTSRQRFLIRQAFDEFMLRGGFPEVTGFDRRLRTKVHQEYFGAIMYRDIVERHNVAHPRMLSELTRRLIDNAGSMYSHNSLTGFLKSTGHKATKAIVSDFLEWLQDAYLLFSVKLFDSSAARVNTNPKKIYCVDQGLVRSLSSGVLANTGHMLENAVFLAIRRHFPDIAYYRGPGGREVDFVVRRSDGGLDLVQVCENMADSATRHREVTGLAEAMKALNVSTGTIVTLDESSTVDADHGLITVVPAWKYMLGLAEDGFRP